MSVRSRANSLGESRNAYIFRSISKAAFGVGLRCNRDMVIAADARARIETLEAGVPVFYWDKTLNLDVMEEPDGRKYEIRFIPGAPRNRNYDIVRMLDRITD